MVRARLSSVIEAAMINKLSSDILQSPVEGLNLHPGAFAEQLEHKPTLMVFLRHFGCMFCREMVRDLRQLSETQPDYPPIVFVCQGTLEEGRGFFAQYWPEARAIVDTPKTLYTALGLRRATWGEMVGIQVWTCSFRAMAKGNFMGKPVGDPWIMPGVFLIQGNEILWAHRFRHQGDNPEWATIPQMAKGGAVSAV
jgi:hypothetical protein